MRIVSKLFSLPETKTLSLDDPQTTYIRKKIIKKKVFLRRIYFSWYSQIIRALPAGVDIQELKILEIGSGPGFLKDLLPEIITSEVFPVPGVDMVLDAQRLPFDSDYLDAIVMTDVFHHIPNIDEFLNEATRCLKYGGVIVMIEPWNNFWAKFVYSQFHHEPFDVHNKSWTLESMQEFSARQTSGPLTRANGALPWIVFARDRHKFSDKYPALEIREIVPQMPLSYILSGGLSMRSLSPGFLFPVFRLLEVFMLERFWGMFARIEVVKRR